MPQPRGKSSTMDQHSNGPTFPYSTDRFRGVHTADRDQGACACMSGWAVMGGHYSSNEASWVTGESAAAVRLIESILHRADLLLLVSIFYVFFAREIWSPEVVVVAKD